MAGRPSAARAQNGPRPTIEAHLERDSARRACSGAVHSTVHAVPLSALHADLTGELGHLTPRSTLSLNSLSTPP